MIGAGTCHDPGKSMRLDRSPILEVVGRELQLMVGQMVTRLWCPPTGFVVQ